MRLACKKWHGLLERLGRYWLGQVSNWLLVKVAIGGEEPVETFTVAVPTKGAWFVARWQVPLDTAHSNLRMNALGLPTLFIDTPHSLGSGKW